MMYTQDKTDSQSEGHNKVDVNRTMGPRGVSVVSLLTLRTPFSLLVQTQISAYSQTWTTLLNLYMVVTGTQLQNIRLP